MSAWTWLTAQGVSQREPVKKATKSPLFKAHVTVTAKDPKESDKEGFQSQGCRQSEGVGVLCSARLAGWDSTLFFSMARVYVESSSAVT